MTNNLLAKLSLRQLKRAVGIRGQIQRLEKVLDRLVGDQSPGTSKPTRKKSGRLSAAAQARISAAMKARWAKVRGQKAKKYSRKEAAGSFPGPAASSKPPPPDP